MYKCKLIYNGLSPRSISKGQTIEFKVDNTKINLFFVGRFDKQKGIDVLLDVYKKYPFQNIKLYLIGDSVLGNLDIQIPDDVIKLGWVEYQQLDDYLSICDAVIIPSRWEGFGLIALDAFKNKKAVIVSNCGVFPEMINNNLNGYIFNIDKQEELMDILCKLDKNKLQEMGVRGYQLYKQKYSAESMNNLIIGEYRKLLIQK